MIHGMNINMVHVYVSDNCVYAKITHRYSL